MMDGIWTFHHKVDKTRICKDNCWTTYLPGPRDQIAEPAMREGWTTHFLGGQAIPSSFCWGYKTSHWSSRFSGSSSTEQNTAGLWANPDVKQLRSETLTLRGAEVLWKWKRQHQTWMVLASGLNLNYDISYI